MNDFANFLLGLGFNLAVALLLVRAIYYPTTHNKSYVFTFLAFNTVIFLVLSFMASFEIGIGVGFGLFAIFSILRYRTETIPIREMTYLFIIAALPIMNSASLRGSIWPQLIAANAAVLVVMLVLEKGWGFRYASSRPVVYEKIELVRPDRRAELLADLESRTGLKVRHVAVGKMDFMRDAVNLTVYFDDPSNDQWLSAAAETVDD